MRLQSIAAFAVLLTTTAAPADLPSPRLDRLVPLGAAAGSTIEVEVTGPDLEVTESQPPRLIFDHPGITAKHIQDRKFSVTVAASVPAGTYDAWIVSKHGISSPRLFAVSHGLTELAEVEPNDDAATAQELPLNAVINGISDGNKDDRYRLRLGAGQRIVIVCEAQKLDSPLDATLILTDSRGKQLAVSSDVAGRDPRIAFIAPAAGEYQITIADLTYRGGLPYRLTVTDRPWIDNLFPRAVQIGVPSSVTLSGHNLGPEAKSIPARHGEIHFETTDATVTAPPELFNRRLYEFAEHPTDHSVLPTAATCTLTGMQFRAKLGAYPANPLPLLVTDQTVTREVEPNDDREKPQSLTLPAIVAGRFDHERDADWYEFTTSEAGVYCLEVYCERIAGRADPYLVIVDEKNNRVAEFDDYGHRINAFDGHLRDPSGTLNLSAKSRYRVLVQDRYRRGGPANAYVLSIRRPRPDFYAAAIHAQNPGPGGTTLRRGGAVYLDLIVHHVDGFRGPITVTAEGLPKGVHAVPNTSSDVRTTFTLWCDPDAPEWVGSIRLLARSRNEAGEELIREVRPYTRVSPNEPSSRPTRHQMIAVLAEVAPFALRPSTQQMTIVAGQSKQVTFLCQRPNPEFTGPVTVIPLTVPGGFKLNEFTIPAGKTEGTVTLEIPANVPPGDYTLSMLGQGQVPIMTRDRGRQQQLVSLPSQPFTVTVQPAAAK